MKTMQQVITDLFGSGTSLSPELPSAHVADINPATGLPLIDSGDGGLCGLDVGGNPYGVDLNHNGFMDS